MKKMLFITLFFLAVPSFFILKIYKEPELKKEINIIMIYDCGESERTGG